MERTHSSASSLAAIVAVMLLAVPTAAGASIAPKSVGEIFVDAKGFASGSNLETSIAESDGLIEGFNTLALGTEVFSAIRVDGFAAAQKFQGVGSSSLTLRGSNAIVSLHDNLHSMIEIAANAPTAITFTLGPEVSATQEGAHGGVIRIEHAAKGYLGSIVALGAEGPKSKGEAFHVKGGEVVARVQAGSEIVFLGKPAALRTLAYQDALVSAAAQGSLASHYVTEFEGSDARTSQVDHGAGSVRTSASAAGSVVSSVRVPSASVLAYDLAYETLPARNAEEVAVFVDGELSSANVWIENGRAQILAPVPAGEHRVSISAGAQASTERQAQAEESGDDGARVYGGFEYHSNGKLTGDFLTSVIPDGRATLLSFTSLASRSEIFQEVTVDGGAEAHFETRGDDAMTLVTPKADLTLLDDAHATLLVAAKAPAEATFRLAADVSARADGADVLLLEGPRGPAGALVLIGHGTLVAANGEARATLEAGDRVVYRGEPDAHESEDAVLHAIAEGRVGAQLLAGIQDGALATKSTSYSDDVSARVRPAGTGMLLVEFLAQTNEAPRGFVLDARGASLVAKAASDIHVTVDGEDAVPAFTPEDVLDAANVPRYFTSTSLDGALRVIVNTAAAAGETVNVVVSSSVESAAHESARTDAFGAFRVYHDGSAIGSFVTLKADEAAGAVSGFALLATSRPVFASLTAGASSFVTTSGDGSSVLKLENREARAEFTDTTSGFAKIVALQETEAAFRLAAGLHGESRGPGVVEIVDGQGEQIGSLLLIGAGEIATRGESDVRARLEQGSELLFRAHTGIESELSAAQRTMINQAIAGERIAGHVIIQTQAELYADATMLESTARDITDSVGFAAEEAFGEVTSSVTASYGAVSVVTAATKERVAITIGSAIATGRTILVSLDPDTIPGMATGDAVIRFDGELAAQASSYADILDATDDAGAAEYFVLAGEAGTQVLVSIPHFSVHTVTLEQRGENSNSLYMYATVFLGLLVVVESALLARGKRSKKTITNNRRP